MITITEKQENSEASPEYLKAFHKFVTGHPLIYDQVKAEIHKRARGSAGGQAKARKAQEGETELEDIEEHLLEDEGPTKVTNAAPMGKVINETDDIIEVEVFPIKEGVYIGTDGIPTLKKYEEFAPYVHWLDGVPITPNHVYPNEPEVTNQTTKLGKLLNTMLDPENRRARSEGRYFKNSITPDRLGHLANGIPHDGSIEYMCGFDNTPGEFQGKHYDRAEVGPYYFYNYAEVPRGACSVSDGCGIQANATGGPFQNAAPESDLFEELMKAPSSHVLVDGRFVKRCPKQTNEADKMEEIEALRADYEKQLNAANEKVTSLEGIVSELSAKLDGLATEHKQLNEAFTSKATAEAAASEAAHKEAFKKQLNAAAATEVDALWGEVRDMNPATYEAWKITNSAKLLTEAEAKTLAGKKTLNSADVVESARAKADATLFKRR